VAGVIRGFAAAMLVGLAACQPTKAPADGRKGPLADTCGAEAIQGLVGQDQSVLATMTSGNPVRVISPGMPITMDHVQTRLNIVLSKDGRIVRIYCG
jgi:Peptidase inhibitor I78 family